MQHYHRKKWQEFRKELFEFDGHVCVRCKRGPLQGAVLQVHHKDYLPGKLPWEYPYALCETLCKGCHAGEHGLVRPFSGWECVGHDDLGDLTGECELCGNSIRHVFFVYHQKWPGLEVGETCCDHLTDTSSASDYVDSLRRFKARQLRFIQSKRWKLASTGITWLIQKSAFIGIEPVDQSYRLIVNHTQGKQRFASVDDAKALAFELFENGKLEAFLHKQKSAGQG